MGLIAFDSHCFPPQRDILDNRWAMACLSNTVPIKRERSKLHRLTGLSASRDRLTLGSVP